jgi:hypothetical protein
MIDKSQSAAAGRATRPKVVIECTYRAKVTELWELWTTKEGSSRGGGPMAFASKSTLLKHARAAHGTTT